MTTSQRMLPLLRPWVLLLLCAPIAYSLQLIPFLGIVAALFMPMTITAIVHIAMALLIVDVALKRTHFAFLFIPLVFYGGFTAWMMRERAEGDALRQRVINMQVNAPVSLDADHVLVADQSAGLLNDLQARYELDLYYTPSTSDPANTHAVQVIVEENCTFEHDAAFDTTRMRLRTQEGVTIENACSRRGPAAASGPAVQVGTTAWRDPANPLAYVETTTIRKDGQTATVVSASTALPMRWPMLDVGCFKECRFAFAVERVDLTGDHTARVAQVLGLRPRSLRSRGLNRAVVATD